MLRFCRTLPSNNNTVLPGGASPSPTGVTGLYTISLILQHARNTFEKVMLMAAPPYELFERHGHNSGIAHRPHFCYD